MQGRRTDKEPIDYQPGDYGLWEGTWYACVPNGDLANLSAHRVAVNEDGILNVQPSILVQGPQGTWHGYLENGVWREC